MRIRPHLESLFCRLGRFAAISLLVFSIAFAVLNSGCVAALADPGRTLLNVSYDPTRELYEDYNKVFASHWKQLTGEEVTINQSHAGSGKQARAVIDGLAADVVTLALGQDIDAIGSEGKLIPSDWQTRLPYQSTPYYSTVVFVVRKGNPKGIKDWSDLVKDGLQVVTPNPKKSGGARWNYLAAYGYALKSFGNDEAKAAEFMGKLFKNVPVLDAGARGATMTFINRQIGDVLLAWENEAYLAMKEFAAEGVEIVVPSISILAEPPVSVVDTNVAKNQTRDVAQAYLSFLYTEEAQALIAKHFFRPRSQSAMMAAPQKFPELQLMTIRDFGGWKDAHTKHFADGALFDQIYAK